MPLCEYEDFDGSLLLKWSGKASGKKPAMFLYHHDVVPSDPSKWTHPPFAGEVADGKLWGRGTLDTKCGLWGVLQAADELAEEDFVPDRGIELDMIYDEGGFILPDSIGCTNGTFAMTAVGEKIPTVIKFIARDTGGHASMPRKNSPLVRISRLITDVEKHDPFPPCISDTAAEMLRCFGPYMNKYKFMASHPKFFGPVLKKLLPKLPPVAGVYMKSTLAFTMSGASPAANVLPSEAWVVGNLRSAF